MSSSNRNSGGAGNEDSMPNKKNIPKDKTSAQSPEDDDSESEIPRVTNMRREQQGHSRQSHGNMSPRGFRAAPGGFGDSLSSSHPTGSVSAKQDTANSPLRLEEKDLQMAGPYGRRTGMDPGKHAPYFTGIKFQWLDNMHLSDEKKPTIGVVRKDLITLKLIDTKGIAHEAIFPDREQMDFNSQPWIDRLYGWRAQFISRKLNNNNDGQSRFSFKRPHWTQQEKDFIKYILVRWITEKRKPLSDDDWKAIAAQYSERFAGKTAQVGEQTPPGLKNGGGMTKGSTLKKAHEIFARPHTAIQSQVNRWPDVKEAMNAALQGFAAQSTPHAGDNNEHEVAEYDPDATESESDNDEVPPDFNAVT